MKHFTVKQLSKAKSRQKIAYAIVLANNAKWNSYSYW